MLYNLYHFIHDSLGMHFWDLPALIVAVILIVVVIVHCRNQKKREKDFEKEREEKLEALRGEDAGSPLDA